LTFPFAPIDSRTARTDRVVGSQSSGRTKVGSIKEFKVRKSKATFACRWEKKNIYLHFDRSHIKRPRRVRSEYEGRKRNDGEKDHYGGGDCGRDIVSSTVDAVHRGERLVVFKVKDTSLPVVFPRRSPVR
jgi:hypothetical protein